VRVASGHASHGLTLYNAKVIIVPVGTLTVDGWAQKRSKVKEIIVLIKARSFLDELNLEHLTS